MKDVYYSFFYLSDFPYNLFNKDFITCKFSYFLLFIKVIIKSNISLNKINILNHKNKKI